jgi:hypothetical protein
MTDEELDDFLTDSTHYALGTECAPMSDASNPLRRFESGFPFRLPMMPWEAEADTEHLYRRERIRIPQMRVRVWEERQLVRELNEKFKASGATELLRPAWLSLGYVDNFFLSEEVLQESRSPAQLSDWLDLADEYLAAAVTQRKFYEEKLERYALTVRPITSRTDATGSKSFRRRRFGGLLQTAARLALLSQGLGWIHDALISPLRTTRGEQHYRKR